MKRAKLALFTVALAVACVTTSQASAEDYVLGEYRLSKPFERAVLDGDTIRVDGLDATLRLLGIDTEETFKKPGAEAKAQTSWRKYVKEITSASNKPVKFGTPMGEKARDWAQRFFRGHAKVRLEIDDPARKRGYYGRYLVYVFVKKNGKWVNYNVECVRAGMSPYFAKYGYSARFHDEFVAAEREARNNKVGIWKKGAKAYPDYKKRLTWWNRRAEAVKKFQKTYRGKDNYFELGTADDWERLKKYEGKKAIVFGTVGDIVMDKSPYRAFMGHRKNEDFSIVSFDKAKLQALKLGRFDGEYIYVEGTISVYKGRPQFRADRETLKIATDPSKLK